ncbi:hypothetical protein DPEC_G00252780 [Dallia pectoralis]|uniref:Uncharacterized protein n=1 Tax=Dallia pectoralis TaxID=75939 RepID=A0ACC2FTW9_DALPE|nr:hypothetical protein DPEC_G00252780 [Dallia pectoralis]
MSGPGRSCGAFCSVHPPPHPHFSPAQPPLRGTMAIIINWLSASFINIHPGWASRQGHGGGRARAGSPSPCPHPPHILRISVSSLRGRDGKIISAERLDRLFLSTGCQL